MSAIISGERENATASGAGWSSLPPEYAIPNVTPTLAEAQAYCQRLARSHYENFSVASWLLPAFANIFSMCMHIAESPMI
jgi:hypothetical protein